MILGNQVEWAVHCMTFLATLPSGYALPGRYLADYHDIPRDYLAKALQALAAAGLLHTAPGPRGGYSLAKPAKNITLLDVVEAVEGKKSTFLCSEIRKKGPCSMPHRHYSPVCAIASAMYNADHVWRKYLAGKTLQDINDEVFGKGTMPLKSFKVDKSSDKTLVWLEGKLNLKKKS